MTRKVPTALRHRLSASANKRRPLGTRRWAGPWRLGQDLCRTVFYRTECLPSSQGSPWYRHWTFITDRKHVHSFSVGSWALDDKDGSIWRSYFPATPVAPAGGEGET